MRSYIAIGIAALFFAATACSSDDNILPKKNRPTPQLDAAPMDMDDADVDAPADPVTDAASDTKKPRDPNANCVKPGTPNNERGIGAYCEPGRGDCESTVGPRFCTADYKELTPIDDDKWFCAALCTQDEDCGTGAICSTSAVGSGCAPFACLRDAGGSLTSLAGTGPSR